MKFRDFLDSVIVFAAAIGVVIGMLYGAARLSEPRHSTESATMTDTTRPTFAPEVPRPVVAPQALIPAQPVAPPEPQSLSSSDINTYNALRTNCFNAARNNATGEYPATQQLACNDYLRFASKIGVQVKDVPTVLIADPSHSTQSPVVIAQQTDIQSSWECAGLYQRKDSIDEAMRNGYTSETGEHYRVELREINKKLYDHRCVRPYGRQR